MLGRRALKGIHLKLENHSLQKLVKLVNKITSSAEIISIFNIFIWAYIYTLIDHICLIILLHQCGYQFMSLITILYQQGIIKKNTISSVFDSPIQKIRFNYAFCAFVCIFGNSTRFAICMAIFAYICTIYNHSFRTFNKALIDLICNVI